MPTSRDFEHQSFASARSAQPNASTLGGGDERRKIALEALKGWDADTKHTLSVTKAILDSVLEWLQKNTLASSERSKRVSDFFDKFQLSVSSSCSMQDFSGLFEFKKQVRSQSRRIVLENSELKDVFEHFDEELHELLDAAKKTENEIKNSIAKRLLKEELAPYQENLAIFFSQILTAKKSVGKDLDSLNGDFDALVKAFDKTYKGKPLARKDQKNVLDFVLSYAQKVDEAVAGLKQYGVMIAKIFEDARVLEVNKFTAFKNAFSTLINRLSELFGSDKTKYFSLSHFLLGKMNGANVGNFIVDLNEAMQPSQVELILKKTQTESLNAFSLQTFVDRLKVEDFGPILDLLTCFRENGILIDEDNTHKKVELFASVDNFYSLYEEKLGANKRELLSVFPVESATCNKGEVKNSLDLYTKERKMFWEEEESFLIIFPQQVIDKILIRHMEMLDPKKKKETLAESKKIDSISVESIFEQETEAEVVKEYKKTASLTASWEGNEDESLNFSSEYDCPSNEKKASDIIFDNDEEF